MKISSPLAAADLPWLRTKLSLVLAVSLLLIPAGRVTAQNFTTLHSFTTLSTSAQVAYEFNSDGANPFAGVVLSGNTLYGTAKDGGSNGNGTVFSVNTDGTGFTILHTFAADDSSSVGANSDGASPSSTLILSGNTLYGTAELGGESVDSGGSILPGNGTVFSVNTNGTGFTVLHSFPLIDGASPNGTLVLSGNTLYGTATSGGSANNGTVFSVNTDGTGFTVLYNFTASTGSPASQPFNGDGAYPNGDLVLSGNTLYGTAASGGSNGNGTVFSVNTNGTVFTVLHTFVGYPSDGANPEAGLILSGNILYGTTFYGSSSSVTGAGTVFKVNTNGTGFTTLYNFIDTNSDGNYSDGAGPNGRLILSANALYGTTYDGGTPGSGQALGNGTVFSVNTDGTGFTNLYRFTADYPSFSTNSDGANPIAGLILSNNTLYGTAFYGGGGGGNSQSGNGTVFSLSLPPPVITSPATATATQGQLFVYQVTAIGTPTNYAATPVPAGVSFDPARGILAGAPTTPGTTQIQLTASNSSGTGTANLTLTIQPAPSSGPVVMSGTSITARTSVSFSYEVFTTGGSPTARLSASGLPPGLSADPETGRISGTPTSDGSFGLTLTVTDGGNVTTSTLQLTFTSDLTIPVIVSSRETSLTVGQFFTYTIVAPSSNPSDPTTFSLIGTLPNGLSFDPTTGTISGTFNVHAQNGGALLGNVQLVSSNSSGTATSPLSFFRSVPASAVNISTRLAVGTSDNVLIGGFIVTGNAPKKVIVRAVGPELTALGVPGALQDTTLELHDGTGALIGTNDDWKTTVIGGAITEDQADAIHTSGAGPTDDRESAIIATLAPYDPNVGGPVGLYTAIVRGKDGTTGVASVELYDLGTASLDVSSKAQLANISTRGVVQTGDNVMIGGFIIQGDSPGKVIVRAIGPSLTAKGVSGALADPTLELHDGTGTLIATNDNWRTTQIGGVIVEDQVTEIQASGVAPTDDRESAILATLPPGNYTGIVRGKNNTTGVALVEAYGLQ